MEVRVLLPADSKQYRQVRLEALRLHPEAFGSNYQAQAELPKLYFEGLIEAQGQPNNDSSTKGVMIGAFVEEKLVGLCGLIKIEAKSMELVQMYVNKDYRGRKIGEALLSKAKQVLAEREESSLQLTVYKHNQAALSAYLRFGFRQTKENRDEITMSLAV